MRHWHIWRLDAEDLARREPEPFTSTTTPSRIIRREERFRASGGFTRQCQDPVCIENYERAERQRLNMPK